MVSSRGIRAGAAYVELYAHDSKLVRGLKRASRRLKAFGANVRNIGARLVKASAVMATPLVAGAKVYADFEQQMANVATMLDKPADHMDAFKKGIRSMAVEFGESTEALAGGLYDILSASIPAEKALEVLAVASRAAKAGLTDTKTAADAITTVLNSYGLAAEHAGAVSDLLFSVVKRGKTTFAELAPQIGMVASTAASAGVGLDELGAALATLTRHGVKTENAVTAVNQIVMSFLKPSKEAADVARQLGFEMSSATLHTEGLAGVFEKISRLSPDAIAKLFPNARALRGVIPALKNMEGFLADIGAMRTGAGATETAYKKMAATLAHAFAQVKQAGLVALSVVGESLAEPLSKAAATIKRYAAFVTDLIARNKGLVVAAAKVVAIIGLVGGALVVVGAAGSALATVFGGIAAIVTGVGTAIGVLGTVLAALVSPIGLVIAAVAALGAYILYATGAAGKALKWLGEKFGQLREFAGEAYRGIADALAAGDIGLAARILWLTLKVAWQKGVGWLLRVWLQFKHGFLSVAYAAFYGTLALARTVWHGIQIAAVEAAAFMLKAWDRYVFAVARAMLWLQSRLTKIWNVLKGKFDETFDPQAANRAVQQQYEYGSQYLKEEGARRQKTLEGARQRVREHEQEQYEAGMAEISRAHQAKKRAMEEEARTRTAAAQAELDQARQEWRAAIAEARRKREAREAADEGPGKLKGPASLVGKVQDSLAGLGDTLKKTAERTISVTGTFSAMAVAGLGAGSVAERTAKATEETAQNTKKLVTETRVGGLTFS
ncbi:MAG TPA: phage tail tape measure protein [Phycisphaerae bacterium]|nr:phage tail tape measure protein [Phycisphaerae bacterium]